jgi:hypothetical protein
METLSWLSSSVDSFLRPIDDAFEPLNVWFDNAALSAGRPPDQLKYIASLLACYPLAILFRLLPRQHVVLQHLYSIVISWFLTTLCLGSFAIFHSLFSSLVTYLILATLPRSVSHKVLVRLPQVNFVWVFGYMSCAHIYRMYVDYMGWTLDFTTMQMVLTIKLTSIGFNYHDAYVFHKLSSAEKEVRILLLSRSSMPSKKNGKSALFRASQASSSSTAGSTASPASLLDLHSNTTNTVISLAESFLMIRFRRSHEQHCKGTQPGLSRVWRPSLFVLGKAFATLPLIALSGMYPVTYLVSAAYTAAPFYEKYSAQFTEGSCA